MTLRLLGNCPECKSLDTIIRLPYERNSPPSKTKCENCGTIWNHWLNDLVEPEEEKGNKLTPVEVSRYENLDVKLYWPNRREIPYRYLIASVLNSALIAKFNLGVCGACEGGVKGKSRLGYFELRNYDDWTSHIGLYTEYGKENVGKVLDLYEIMLRQLFEEPLSFGNINFRRGEILRLEKKEETYSDAMILLFGTLTTTVNRKFAEKVLKTEQKIKQNPFSAPYLSGLTAEDIARIFVPPPSRTQ